MGGYAFRLVQFSSNILANDERNLRDLLHKFVIIVYLDDVFIYNRTLEEHIEHLGILLRRFKEECFKLRLKKMFCGLQEIKYMGYIVSSGKLSIST
jgi:hypothetical protein